MTGTWVSINQPPGFNTDTMLLLTDGRVLWHENNSPNWHTLTPDAFGSYVNGAWSPVASMPDNAMIPVAKGGPTNAPLYFASALLRDGRVFVAGGEYNLGTPNADLLAVTIYDPLTNTWMQAPTPKDASGVDWGGIGDAPACVLSDGRVLLGCIFNAHTALYDPAANLWTAAADKLNRSSTEETWTLLPDGTVLSVNCADHPWAQKYLPAADAWVAAGAPLDDLVEANSNEIGPALVLPSGGVFAVGATNHTAIYTPPALPNLPGTWTRGPAFPLQVAGQDLGAKDAPACLLPNGKVLCVAGGVDGSQGNYLPPTYFFEFDPVAGTLTRTPENPANNPLPPAGTFPPPGNAPYVGRMLLLPNGQVLFSNSGQTICVYSPNGAPDAAWKPHISNCPTLLQAGKTYVLRGTQLNGLSGGCSYGDDAMNPTNYPMVRIRNLASGHMFYCRTANHSTMGVATGAVSHSTEFATPAGLEAGPAELTVVANGIASDPLSVNIGCPPRMRRLGCNCKRRRHSCA